MIIELISTALRAPPPADCWPHRPSGQSRLAGVRSPTIGGGSQSVMTAAAGEARKPAVRRGRGLKLRWARDRTDQVVLWLFRLERYGEWMAHGSPDGSAGAGGHGYPLGVGQRWIGQHCTWGNAGSAYCLAVAAVMREDRVREGESCSRLSEFVAGCAGGGTGPGEWPWTGSAARIPGFGPGGGVFGGGGVSAAVPAVGRADWATVGRGGRAAG
jgi:hypothetical protein